MTRKRCSVAAKIIGVPTLADTGLKLQHDLLIALRAAGQSPPILDARLLLSDPHSVLCQLCDRLGLGFDVSMLSWEAGGNAADGVWAPYWYGNVHREYRIRAVSSEVGTVSSGIRGCIGGVFNAL